ncbi:hypothetical protein EDEG_02564 [Edhazardia aedis USNM 41457]|uniref:Elongin-C n=1 Tax=Edhazardia aedis (strain USNM 41457) TaxID=1003232 RepID=J9DKD0_EDHAE|nr:hypothetical protein EDEG_02564 [Edhazardia aedis USNM 41457]|eukprot:EJW03045.1 hypothetical protein EDEG_02564 [Edhazardia aedis USNM 41457]
MDSYKEKKCEERKLDVEEGKYELISVEGTSYFITQEEVKESNLLIAFFNKKAPYIEKSTKSVKLPINDSFMNKIVTYLTILSSQDESIRDLLIVDLTEDEIYKILEISSYMGM